MYNVSENELIIVTTDRISAQGRLLPVKIKNKGIVLNKLSSFWFDITKDIVDNHILEVIRLEIEL